MKQIDPKFHCDGERIIKTSNGEAIPDDEPVILFRGRDKLALPLLRIYHELCLLDGCNDFQTAGIENRIAAFEQFRERQPDRMKQPGITRGK